MLKKLRVLRYCSNRKKQWDTFVQNAKNATFLHERDFMEYHQERFEDFSLLVFQAEKLIALLPANRTKDCIFSHQGLTYGGLVLAKKIKFEVILAVFSEILQFLKKEKVQELRLKLIPEIYRDYPSDEIEYLLFLVKAQLFRRDLSAAIYNPNRIPLQSNRKEGVKKARSQRLHIKKVKEFTSFWEEILEPNLWKKHEAMPVHTAEEIERLAEKFQQIQQFNVYAQKELVGGATIFVTKNVAHVQYISANNRRQELGTLDFLFQYLIEEEFAHKPYFDFGTSNENRGQNVNRGLLYWKECFGARGIVHDFYSVNPKNHTLLERVLLSQCT